MKYIFLIAVKIDDQALIVHIQNLGHRSDPSIKLWGTPAGKNYWSGIFGSFSASEILFAIINYLKKHDQKHAS